MTFKNNVISSLIDFKLDITDRKNKRIAYLKPITQEDSIDFELIQKVTQWREENKSCFLSEFIPTFERTQGWIKNAIINNEKRILFKVYTDENELVGHIGAINRDKYIEYDYYIIGKKVDVKDFALIIALKFLLWLFDLTDTEYIMGQVRSDNTHAISFHLRTGFKIYKETPLKKVVSSDSEFKFEPSLSGHTISKVKLIEIRAFKSDLKIFN